MLACGASRLDTVTLLLDKGAALETRDTNLWTALIWAARAGSAEIMVHLLDRGADIEVKNSGGE